MCVCVGVCLRVCVGILEIKLIKLSVLNVCMYVSVCVCVCGRADTEVVVVVVVRVHSRKIVTLLGEQCVCVCV